MTRLFPALLLTAAAILFFPADSAMAQGSHFRFQRPLGEQFRTQQRQIHRPNIHVRVRHDVRVAVSNEASVGGTSLFQNDLTGFRYVWRGGMFIHDLNRAVVSITNGS